MRAYHYENNLKLQGIVDHFFFRVHRPRPSAHLARVLVDFRKEKTKQRLCTGQLDSTGVTPVHSGDTMRGGGGWGVGARQRTLKIIHSLALKCI